MKQFLFLTLISISLFSCNNKAKKQAESNKREYFLPPPTGHHYLAIGDVKLFYRAAGNPKNPTIVLLHGYPSSSHTYRHLIPMLATHYYVIAPDNLGSGYSTHLNPDSTHYTFDLLAEYTQKLVDRLGIKKYVMYMQDFGAPVGYRMMMKDPERIEALIVQNANAYLAGLTEKRQAFFRTAQSDTSAAKHAFLYGLTGADAIINQQYLFDLDSTNVHLQSPDAWTHDLAFLSSEKDREIQVQLFQDYNNNLLAYPTWQKMLREQQPKTLIVWGAKDQKFNANGAKAYLKDLPNATLHLLDAGHFAAEEKTREIASFILSFLDEQEIK
ncbi:alpha/beta fold hydrolase [Putridiphycobacter roseus]|nr:alpha/beta hydrolase [Putridiphycobacter roseus]